MNIFYRRHLALFCTIFAATSVCSCFLAYDGKITAIIASLSLAIFLAFITLFLKRHKAVCFKSALCILFVSIALLSQFARVELPFEKIEKYVGKQANVTAVVKSVNFSKDFISVYSVEVKTINKINVNTSAILECDYNAELQVGELITGCVYVNKIDSYSETSTYYKAKNITLYFHSPENLVSTQQAESLSVKLSKLNQTISRIITQEIDGEAGNLVSALMLGNKDLLDDSVTRDFRRAGLSHVLAISGMHLSILIFFLDYILKKLNLSKLLRGGIVMPTALFYLALSGFSSSTVRAFIMSAIVYLAFVLQDESDLLTTLFFALFIILFISPNSVYDIGLWLSFLAVVGIFVAQYFIQALSDFLYAKLNRKKIKDKYVLRSRKNILTSRNVKVIIYIFSSISITIFANIFICVPTWLYFSEISLISVLTNLIVSPIVTVILYLSPVFLLTSFIDPVYKILGSIIEIIGNLLLSFISYVTSFSQITVSMNYTFVGPITVALAIILTLCLVLKLKHKWTILIPPIIAGLVFSGCLALDRQYYKNIVQIDYIGGNESEMILLRDGDQYSIIDISTGGAVHSNNAYILSQKNCATELYTYVITHYHNYHVNSIRKILKKALVHKLYLPYPQNLDEYYIMCALVTVANNEGTDIIIYDSLNETQITDNVTLNLSERYFLKRSTHPIFYFTLESREQYYTYFSESLFEIQETENELFNTFKKSDFILLGAHGPKTKSDIIFPNISLNQHVIIANDDINRYITSITSCLNKLSDVIYFRTIISQK